MYNYLDLQLKNPTSHPIQLLLHLDDNFFYGEFRTNAELPYSYRVIEKNHFLTRSTSSHSLLRLCENYLKTILNTKSNQIKQFQPKSNI